VAILEQTYAVLGAYCFGQHLITITVTTLTHIQVKGILRLPCAHQTYSPYRPQRSTPITDESSPRKWSPTMQSAQTHFPSCYDLVCW